MTPAQPGRLGGAVVGPGSETAKHVPPPVAPGAAAQGGGGDSNQDESSQGQSLNVAYPSKDALYRAVVRDWVDRGHDAMRPYAEALASAAAVRDALHIFARILQRGLLSRPVLQMRTLVAGEATWFAANFDRLRDPQLGPQHRVARRVARQPTGRGLLETPDPSLAAEQFTWLVVAAPLNRLTLAGGTGAPEDAELGMIATEAVATFRSRYGTGGRRP